MNEKEMDMSDKAEKLIREAKILIEIEEFDDAIDKYDEAIKFYKEIGNESAIEKIYELIEKSYDYKTEFLRKPKYEEKLAEKDDHEQYIEISEKEQKLREFEETKSNLEKITNQAYELMEQGSKLIESYDFDGSLELYEEAAKLFNEVNWTYELQKVQSTIIQIKKDKEVFLKELELKKEQKDNEIELKVKQEEHLDEVAKKRKEIEEEEKSKKLIEIESKREEEENFNNQITLMLDNAENMAREYELEKKNAIKNKTLLDLEPPYHEIVEIYNNIRDMLLKRGWGKQAELYRDSIRIASEKLEQDKKLRVIEAKKIENQQEYEDTIRTKIGVGETESKIGKLKAAQERYEKQLEDEFFQTQITEVVKNAEKLAHEYELKRSRALKEGNLDFECVYPELIKTYIEINDKLLKKGWVKQTNIYSNQIKIYNEKIKQDEKLRAVEESKKDKQKLYEETFKSKSSVDELNLDVEKLKAVQDKYEKELENEFFQKQVSEVIDNAEKRAHEYERKKLEALKEGNLDFDCIYPELIEVYKEVRDMLLKRNWLKQAEPFIDSIRICQEKLTQDMKLREIEAQKIQKQLEYEEFIKAKKEVVRVKVDANKEKAVKNKVMNKKFETQIYEMVDRAISMERKYELAVRRGKIIESPPYETIVEIYTKVKNMLLEEGRDDDAKVYNKQIDVALQKLEKIKNT